MQIGLSILLAVAWAAPFAAMAAPAIGEDAPSSKRFVLAPGWNLRSFDGVKARDAGIQLHAAGVEIWRVEVKAHQPVEYVRVRGLPTDEGFDANGVYWLRAQGPLTLVVRGLQEPGGTGALTAANHEGWRLQTVATATPVSELGVFAARGWNAPLQRYVSLLGHDVLQKTHGYWVHVTSVENDDPDAKEIVAKTGLHQSAARGFSVANPGIWNAFDEAGGLASVPLEVAIHADEARRVRDQLLRSVTDQDFGLPLYYQVEYQPATAPEEDPEGTALQAHAELAEDSRVLAGFQRVWAYTQGIALAQAAREADPLAYGRAQGMARYLCQHRVSGRSNKSLGWHFSWNTHGDDWKDARLVTGATAWAAHGIGLFVTSQAFQALPLGEEKRDIQQCYRRALQGLKDHQRFLRLADGQEVILMTAGWTAVGLLNVDTPWALMRPDGQPVTQDRTERWGYYSVLDAIGYDTYVDPPKIKFCSDASGFPCGGTGSEAWGEKEIDENTWALLKKRVLAENVVTEHNIDVLSVLNHAIQNSEALGLDDQQDLVRWRDKLRDGIFHALWDDEDRIGRVITGGELHRDASGALQFQPSTHTAIDNCSWLALAVDYPSLDQRTHEGPAADYPSKLERCLDYTSRRFIKDLPFGAPACGDAGASCPEIPTYRGAHYFQNAFQDAYIQPSALQASSYHLEATMGLIAGLLRFADAYPQATKTPYFRDEALGLWAEAQRLSVTTGLCTPASAFRTFLRCFPPAPRSSGFSTSMTSSLNEAMAPNRRPHSSTRSKKQTSSWRRGAFLAVGPKPSSRTSMARGKRWTACSPPACFACREVLHRLRHPDNTRWAPRSAPTRVW